MKSKICLFLALVFSLSGCGGGGGSDTGGGTGGNPALQDKIVVVSDSVGSGFNASIKFPDVLAQRTGLPIVNFSVPGQSAEQGVSFIPGLITKEKPRYLVVLLGLNNAAGADGGPEGAVDILQVAADLANGSGVIAIIGTLPPVIRTPKESSNGDWISQGIRGIKGARIADNRAVMNGSHISSDGFHPNDAGQDVIGNVFADQIF